MLKKYFIVFEIHTFHCEEELHIAKLNYEVERNFIQSIEDIRNIEAELLQKLNVENPLEDKNYTRMITVIDWKRFE